MKARLPRNGDVLISNPSATVEREICILPRAPHLACANHDRAVETARLLARQLGVDAWLTEDYRHYLHIATYRS